MKRLSKNLAAKTLVALLLGVLLTFAFAPYGFYLLAIIAPAGLLMLWQTSTPKQAFWLGFIFGLGLFGVGIYWVYISIHTIGDVSLPLSSLITASLIMLMALYSAVVGYCLMRFFPAPTPINLLCIFPTLWVLGDWVRDWLFTGFPWLFIGYSQTQSPLRGFAPLLSVYGVSFVVLLASGLLVYSMPKKSMPKKPKKWRRMIISLLAILSLFIVGHFLAAIRWTTPDGKPLRIAAVQGNIPQVIKWSPDYLQLSIDRYLTLTAPLWGTADVIIWPETAIPLSLQDATSLIHVLDDEARKSGTDLILGIPIQVTNAAGLPEEGAYNAIVSVGQQPIKYIKRHLVPFGEYTPFAAYLDHPFNALNIPLSDVEPGLSNQPLPVVKGVKVMPAICYEIAFPELMRTDDAQLGFILTITNDAWFGRSNAQAQHLQMAKMRAIELGRPVVFVSNDGITAFIDPLGHIVTTAPPHQQAVLRGTIQPMHGLTPWMRFGVAPILCVLIAILLLVSLIF